MMLENYFSAKTTKVRWRAHCLTRLTGVVWCTASEVEVTAKLPSQLTQSRLDRPAGNISLHCTTCILNRITKPNLLNEKDCWDGT